MDSDLLNIISSGGGSEAQGNTSPSSFPSMKHVDEGVGDLLNPRPRSLGDDTSNGTTFPTSYFGGLNLGRSQSAAPETWEYRKTPSSTTRSSRSTTLGGFLEEDEVADGLDAMAGLRRPASTGVIGRPNNDDGVDSILETLGLATLDGKVDTTEPSNSISAYTPDKPLGGIGSSGTPLSIGGRSSLMDSSNNIFSNQGSGQMGGLQPSNVDVSAAPSASATTSQQYQESLSGKNQGSMGMGQQQLFQNNQHVQQQQSQQTTQHTQAAYQQSQSLYEQPHHHHQQQQVYYQQQQHNGSPQNNQQDFMTHHQQQQANMNIMHNPQMGGGQQQQTIYVNAPAPQYGYHNPPQHVSHGMPANHIMMAHQQVPGPTGMHGQPQYISIVPIQAGHHVLGSAPGQYAYVQYGVDGSMQMAQPTLVAGGGAPTTFVMGPNGPIAVQSTSQGVVPMNAMNYVSGHGTSPPGGAGGGSPRTPRNSALRSPDRSGKGSKKASMSSPRAKRNDKNAPTTSKLGPEAANLLNEIRAAKSRNQWTIQDIQGHVVEFCLDQNGSRFIQQRLEVAAPGEKHSVMDEIIPAMKDLQNDVFGNYVVQKLYEFGTPSMKKDLKGTLKGNMLLLSLQMYGCRVVQKALESLDYDDLCELLEEFDSYVLTCIQDQNGNHVMQKCIEVMSTKATEQGIKKGDESISRSMSQTIQFIVDDVLANIKTLCCHPYGCRVLQRMLEHCVEFQKTATLDKIQLCHKALLDDQYGNYVIQHVLQYGRKSDRDSLLKIIVENDLLKLSRQKFASNVVEKLLKYGNGNQRNGVVREMLKVVNEGGSGEGSTVVLLMVRDAYANYVVQTAIDVVPEGNEKRMLLDELKANEMQLRNYTFAKHIVAKLGTK